MADVQYFHGGVPGLRPGQEIWARASLPHWWGQSVSYGQETAESIGDTGTYIYLTADLEAARSYAGQYVEPTGDGGVRSLPGSVYRVEPAGELLEDPDFLPFPEVFKRARWGRIVEVVETGVRRNNPRMAARSMGKYMSYIDGRPVYDENGYLQPSPTHRRYGMTAERLKQFGKWIPLECVAMNGALVQGASFPPLLPDG